MAAALQELKATRVHVGKEKDHPCDLSFSGQTDTVGHACGDLRKQVKINLYLFMAITDMEKIVPEKK